MGIPDGVALYNSICNLNAALRLVHGDIDSHLDIIYKDIVYGYHVFCSMIFIFYIKS